jgi:hypothetical protein
MLATRHFGLSSLLFLLQTDKQMTAYYNSAARPDCLDRRAFQTFAGMPAKAVNAI